MKLNRLLTTFILIVALSGCDKQGDGDHANHEEQNLESEYACPMGCEGPKTYEKPGNCPVCGMLLVQVQEGLIQAVSPSRQVLSRQRTVRLDTITSRASIQIKGIVKMDESRSQTVSTRFAGRIEKLFVSYDYQKIRKGDPVMDLYSPELNAALSQHLDLIRNGPDNRMLEASRSKLLLMGVSESLVQEIEQSRVVPRAIRIFSDADGYVIFDGKNSEMADSEDSEDNNTGMEMQGKRNAGPARVVSSSRIREGAYVNAGDAIFTVNDLKAVWAIMSVHAQQLENFREGEMIEVESESRPEMAIAGKVLRVERAFIDPKQPFAQVRVSLPNPYGHIKLNSLVSAVVPSAGSQALSVPSSAVLRTGISTYVWVRQGKTKAGTGIFQIRKVVAGPAISGKTTVFTGLLPEEEIALEAGMMIDQETLLKQP